MQKQSFCHSLQTLGLHNQIILSDRNIRNHSLSTQNLHSLESGTFRSALFDSINNYAIVAVKSTIYIFGGDFGESNKYTYYTPTKTIASFSTITKKWKKLGELKRARLAHGVIIRDGDFIVIGGRNDTWASSFETERCSLKDNSVQCSTVAPVLQNYVFYPEMMRVPHDYCEKKEKSLPPPPVL